jgi:CheY-like chemotaxis protein
MKPLLLVVDDDVDDIEFIKEAVSQIPHAPELLCFLNAEEVWQFLKKIAVDSLPPIAISLDINLPGINGIELLIRLKNDDGLQNIPVSMVTTSNSDNVKEQCLANGACHFFTKPVSTSDWIIIISSIMSDVDEKNSL